MDAAELARRERKREARRLREAEEAAAQEGDAEEAPAAETEEERRERKRKRKEAKRRLREAGAAAPEQAVKRSKAVGGASARAVCAKVGDHEAAAKGAPIAKSFYNESDELAALSSAVRARSRGSAAAAGPPVMHGADRRLPRRAGGGEPARGAAHLRGAGSRCALQARALLRGGQLPQERARLLQVRRLTRARRRAR